MRRISIRIMGLLAALLGACLPVLAQDFSQKPKAPNADELPGRQLIVWSETQRPEPMPATSDETSAEKQTHTVSGVILVGGADLFLAAAGGAFYRIQDNPNELRASAGKKVRIRGNLLPGSRELHVLAIGRQ